MSGPSSSRCLLCRLAQSTTHTTSRSPARRTFHSTPGVQGRAKPSFTNIRAVDLGLIKRAEPVARSPDSRNVTKQAPRKTASKSTSKPAYPDLRARNDAFLTSQLKAAASEFPEYTPREKQLLALKYTPEQMRALEAAEASIPAEVLAAQGKMRNDSMKVEYKDDFSKILPIIDHPVRAPDADVDPDIRPLSQQETNVRFGEWYEKLLRRTVAEEEGDYSNMSAKGSDGSAASTSGSGQEGQPQTISVKVSENDVFLVDGETDTRSPSPLKLSREQVRQYGEGLADMQAGLDLGIHAADNFTPKERLERLRRYAQLYEGIDEDTEFERFMGDASNFFYSPKGTLNSQSDALAPAIPRLEDPRITTGADSDDPAMDALALQTGMSRPQMSQLEARVLVHHRVVNQTHMGKIQSIYVLSVAGDGKGLLGIGEGKSTEFSEATHKSKLRAIRNMKPIPRYEERTIFGEVEAKVAASIVKLSARPPGFGNRCQSLIFEMARAAGIRDLSARCLRSRNKMNVVKATYEALMSQRLPEEVAMARGRKMVDVRKVYYEGTAL